MNRKGIIYFATYVLMNQLNVKEVALFGGGVDFFFFLFAFLPVPCLFRSYERTRAWVKVCHRQQ